MHFPRCCKLFGIKTPLLPSHAVYQATGRHCPAFRKAARIRE